MPTWNGVIIKQTLNNYISSHKDAGCGLGWPCLECPLRLCLDELPMSERLHANQVMRFKGVDALLAEYKEG